MKEKKVKLINKGKGTKGTGVNDRIVACIPHETLPLSKSFTFWATADFKKDETIEVDFTQFVTILNNLESKTNENGTFQVWNGKY